MSKYQKLWEYINQSSKDKYELTFEEIEKILGFSIDHSFLKYKSELEKYGYHNTKISLKKEIVIIEKM